MQLLRKCRRLAHYFMDRSSISPDKFVLKEREDILQYLHSLYLNRDIENNEYLFMLALDENRSLLHCTLLSSRNGGKVHTDLQSVIQVLKIFLPSGIILSHSHPKGDHCPSLEDIVSTNIISKLCEDFGTKFLDHIIYTSDGYFSFLEENALEINLSHELFTLSEP